MCIQYSGVHFDNNFNIIFLKEFEIFLQVCSLNHCQLKCALNMQLICTKKVTVHYVLLSRLI